MSLKRHLGTSEYMWMRMGQIDSNNFVMVARVSGKIREENVRQALADIVDAQVMLRAKIDGTGSEPMLSISDTVKPVFDIFERKSNDHWQDEVEHELNEIISVSSPLLWRFKWLKGDEYHDFLLTFNHMIADGRSGLNFYKCFFEKMNNPDFQVPHNLLFPPYEEELSSKTQKGSYVLGWLKAFTEVMALRKKNWFKLPGKEVNAANKTGLVSTSLGEEELDRVLSICRKENTTLTNFLSAIMVNSVDSEEKENVAISIAVDVRPFLENEHDGDIGYFVSTVDLWKTAREKRDIWQLSRDFGKNIKSKLCKSRFKFDEWSRAFVMKSSKTNEEFKALIHRSVNNSMLLTNLGRSDMQTKFSEFKVNSCFHVPAVHLIELPFFCLASASLNGKMQLNLTYPTALIDEQQAEDFMNKVLAGLQNY